MVPDPGVRLWATRPGAEQWTLLAQAWLAMTRTPALDNERDASGSRVSVLSREAARSGTPDARRSTVEALAGLPVGAAPQRRPRGAAGVAAAPSPITVAAAGVRGDAGGGGQLGVTGPGRPGVGAGPARDERGGGVGRRGARSGPRGDGPRSRSP